MHFKIYMARFYPLTLILALLLISGCSTEKKTSDTESHQKSTISYLALGDSYTIGESVSEQLRWPVQLSDSLEAQGYTVNETRIIAKTGWTTAELQEGIEQAQPDSSYDLVSLLIGVNNQYRGYDIDIYKTEFRELLEQSIAFASGDTSKVFVVSIPNYGVTPFGLSKEESIRTELLEYDAIAESIASEYGIPFVNITPISEKAKDDPSLVAMDNLHPSGSMYTQWVSEILPVVTTLLEQ
jgi:lysophospholipase L1-like esterase